MSGPGLLLAVLLLSLGSGDSRFIIDPLPFVQQSYLTLDICSECSQIVQLSANMISSRDTKETVYEALHALCQRLPQDQASDCSSQVKAYLPKVLQQMPGNLKPGDICMVFRLCAAHNVEEQQKLSHHASDKDISIPALNTAVDTHEVFSPICSLCVLVIKKLETLLPENMTEDALMKLMEEVCDLIPQSYKDQCDDFVDNYGEQIVEFLLSSAAPHTICTLLHLCMFKEQAVAAGYPEVPYSDCDSCRTLAVLGRLHLAPNSTQSETASFLQSVCVKHPNAIPKCMAFIKIYGSRLQEVLRNQMEVCERADLCIASKKLEPLGKNRCTWGPNYWCKDVETAKKCGNQAFCEKYMWKQ